MRFIGIENIVVKRIICGSSADKTSVDIGFQRCSRIRYCRTAPLCYSVAIGKIHHYATRTLFEAACRFFFACDAFFFCTKSGLFAKDTLVFTFPFFCFARAFLFLLGKPRLFFGTLFTRVFNGRRSFLPQRSKKCFGIKIKKRNKHQKERQNEKDDNARYIDRIDEKEPDEVAEKSTADEFSAFFVGIRREISGFTHFFGNLNEEKESGKEQNEANARQPLGKPRVMLHILAPSNSKDKKNDGHSDCRATENSEKEIAQKAADNAEK